MISVVPYKLSPEIVSMLEQRIGDEYKAFFFYRSASNWCSDKGFKKAAAFFAGEANAEKDHALKIEEYLVSWNVIPLLPAPEVTAPVYNDLADVISAAYMLEYRLYEDYEDISAKIFESKDLCVFDFLQEYRIKQKESVAEYADMINILSGVNTLDKFQMLMLEKKLFS